VVAAEAGFIRQPHDAQRLGDGTLAGCQDGAPDQHQDMDSLPTAFMNSFQHGMQ
jgi:hypothetical protein